MNIIQALRDKKVFGSAVRGKSWDAWRTFMAALFALPMTDEQLALYRPGAPTRQRMRRRKRGW